MQVLRAFLQDFDDKMELQDDPVPGSEGLSYPTALDEGEADGAGGPQDADHQRLPHAARC